MSWAINPHTQQPLGPDIGVCLLCNTPTPHFHNPSRVWVAIYGSAALAIQEACRAAFLCIYLDTSRHRAAHCPLPGYYHSGEGSSLRASELPKHERENIPAATATFPGFCLSRHSLNTLLDIPPWNSSRSGRKDVQVLYSLPPTPVFLCSEIC